DIMTKHPQVVTPDTPVQEAARLMKSEDTGVLPVVEAQGSRRPVGVITDRDIALRVVAEGRSQAMVRDAMSSSVRTAREDDDLKDVMELMASEQVRRVPIVDDRGELVGIVSQADIVLEGDDKRAEKTIERISQPGR
ncbi:MAG TPA: CBS domain-containing protein, partial [Gemmatirosa sp.]|nr:CBS domain-containing protein [Gemmatirosa sp.]